MNRAAKKARDVQVLGVVPKAREGESMATSFSS